MIEYDLLFLARGVRIMHRPPAIARDSSFEKHCPHELRYETIITFSMPRNIGPVSESPPLSA